MDQFGQSISRKSPRGVVVKLLQGCDKPVLGASAVVTYQRCHPEKAVDFDLQFFGDESEWTIACHENAVLDLSMSQGDAIIEA